MFWWKYCSEIFNQIEILASLLVSRAFCDAIKNGWAWKSETSVLISFLMLQNIQ